MSSGHDPATPAAMACQTHDCTDMSTTSPPRRFALIPAAGVGARMGTRLPKQYMMLAGKPMLQYALDIFAASAAIAHTFVVVSPDDGYIDDVLAALPHLHGKVTVLRHGGASRQQSVLNGLHTIRAQLGDHDWVLVHDAARPLLDNIMLEQLISAVDGDKVGGLLALPIVDTLKRSHTGRVQNTVSRDELWAAQTPQMFRYGLLTHALERAMIRSEAVTDDASAIEMLGMQPKLVAGNPRNFKVTLEHDIALAEIFLKG